MKLNSGSSQFEIRKAKTRLEMDEHIALRKKVFSETYAQKSSLKDLYSQTMDEDNFDSHSVFFNAYLGPKIVATVRCILDSDEGLPLEKEGLQDCSHFRKKGKVMEIGRFAIISEYRMNPFLLNDLLKAVGNYALRKNVCFFLIEIPQHLLNLYQKIGFIIFGEPYFHHTSEFFYPAYLETGKLVQQLVKKKRTENESMINLRFTLKEKWEAYWFLFKNRLLYQMEEQSKLKKENL